MASFVQAVEIDLKRLHETWMELIFPRQRGAEDTVFGKYTPDSSLGMAGYRAWSVTGMVALAVLYPLAVAGFATRFYVRRVDSAATRLGLAGVVILTALVWGALTVVSYVRLPFASFVPIAAASVVATLSSALAVLFKRVGGRATTVLVAYPFGVTAFALPPVVAAFFSPTLGSLIFPSSTSLAAWFLNDVLPRIGLGRAADYLHDRYELRGGAYVAMWFLISVPVGWFFGGLVTLANLVRPGDR